MQFFFCFCFTWLNKQRWGREGNGRGHFSLFLAKSFSFLDGKEQLLFQLLEALIGRQVQAVETDTKGEDERSAQKDMES